MHPVCSMLCASLVHQAMIHSQCNSCGSCHVDSMCIACASCHVHSTRIACASCHVHCMCITCVSCHVHSMCIACGSHVHHPMCIPCALDVHHMCIMPCAFHVLIGHVQFMCIASRNEMFQTVWVSPESHVRLEPHLGQTTKLLVDFPLFSSLLYRDKSDVPSPHQVYTQEKGRTLAFCHLDLYMCMYLHTCTE